MGLSQTRPFYFQLPAHFQMQGPASDISLDHLFVDEDYREEISKMNIQSERTANTKGPEVGVLGKKKQVHKGRSRTSKEKITHHEIGGEWHGQIMQGFDGHHKDFWLLH